MLHNNNYIFPSKKQEQTVDQFGSPRSTAGYTATIGARRVAHYVHKRDPLFLIESLVNQIDIDMKKENCSMLCLLQYDLAINE